VSRVTFLFITFRPPAVCSAGSAPANPTARPPAGCFHCVVDSGVDQARVVTTPDGRQLAYLEVGDPHGPLVLHNHCGPSSWLDAADEIFAVAAKELGVS
jgi:hypothetical protein